MFNMSLIEANTLYSFTPIGRDYYGTNFKSSNHVKKKKNV